MRNEHLKRSSVVKWTTSNGVIFFLSLGELETELITHALCRPYNIMTVILEIQQSNLQCVTNHFSIVLNMLATYGTAVLQTVLESSCTAVWQTAFNLNDYMITGWCSAHHKARNYDFVRTPYVCKVLHTILYNLWATCEIWGSHYSDYVEFSFLRCDTV